MWSPDFENGGKEEASPCNVNRREGLELVLREGKRGGDRTWPIPKKVHNHLLGGEKRVEEGRGASRIGRQVKRKQGGVYTRERVRHFKIGVPHNSGRKKRIFCGSNECQRDSFYFLGGGGRGGEIGENQI